MFQRILHEGGKHSDNLRPEKIFMYYKNRPACYIIVWDSDSRDVKINNLEVSLGRKVQTDVASN